jgi:Raf kinase inhibitor-like YbhB/YbcL family protein
MDAQPPLPLPLLLAILLLQLPLMLVVPLLLGRWVRRRFDVGWAVFGVGALTFVASQVVHIPLNWAVGLIGAPPRGLGLLPLPALAAAAGLSAGLCEELARFVTLRFIYRRARGYEAALQFGAGHGGIEAMILGLLVAASLVTMLMLRVSPGILKLTPDQSWQVESAAAAFWASPWYMAVLGGVERLFAMTSHVLFTVLVMRAVTRGKPGWLLLAILAHAALDALAVVCVKTLGPVWTEVLLAIWGVIAVALIVRMRAPRPAPTPPAAALAPTALLLGVLLVAGQAGCRQPGDGPPTPPPPSPTSDAGHLRPKTFALGSPVARSGDLLPSDYGCDGRNVSPPLVVEAVPYRTRSFALVVEDPDALAGAATQWIAWGIPGTTRALPEGVKGLAGMREGAAGSGVVGWVGPCPPPGPPHRYHFRLYALDSTLDLAAGSSLLQLHAAMYNHILVESVLTLRYARAAR